MDHLGSLVVIASARKAGDPGSNPGPGENFSPKLITLYINLICSQVQKLRSTDSKNPWS